MHEQMQRHKHLTLQLLWEEYRQAEPNGYAYSFFCELYRDWKRKPNASRLLYLYRTANEPDLQGHCFDRAAGPYPTADLLKTAGRNTREKAEVKGRFHT